MPLGDELAQNMLQVLFGAATPAVPGVWWIGLSLAEAQPDLEGGSAVEPDPATGYARVPVPNTADMWTADAGRPRQVANAAVVQFPQATAAWGELGWWCLFEQATGGPVRGYGSFGGFVSPQAGQQPQFPAGALVVLAPYF